MTKHAVTTEQMWDIKDVMSYLGYSYAQVRRFCQEQGLPYHKVGRGRNAQLRFIPEEVRSWGTQNGIDTAS